MYVIIYVIIYVIFCWFRLEYYVCVSYTIFKTKLGIIMYNIFIGTGGCGYIFGLEWSLQCYDKFLEENQTRSQ